ncbi:catalytics protein [Perilla frutescens var. hirtella]|uniref:Catalytics protein n=1 Tax=Perilla frutescens var. hirtella TaxID=608512 RepID=A0AAD4NYK3_PERFH|nr:catalytics protein [Perilla frutescens var. hirtella]
MGGNHFVKIIQFFILLQFLDCCFALPLCTDSRAPFTSNSTLQFCRYNGTACCNSSDDLVLKKQFESMKISDPGCASLVKSILCARCDQFSAELFRVDYVPRQLPVLCNSTISPNSTQSSQASLNFCSQVWNTCQNVSILNSPFAASLQGRAGVPTTSNSSKLSDLWQSQADFCGALGGASDDGLPCFDGTPVTLNDTGPPTPPSGLCLEKIANGSYLNMVAHPDGSNRAFFSNQQGKIWLATIPNQGSGGALELDESDPFLDLTDQVHFDTQFGLMGIALHPNFKENGRLFASFNCDKAKWPDCAGRCACNSDVNCDPSKLSPDNGANPCQFHSVVAEFTTNGTASATSANPSEVRRIFTMGLPFTSHHAGQILFGPKDGYLYFMMGDGGGVGDPYNFAQNKKSLLGKIMRFDVDTIPSATEASQLGLWGNYSIPKDNPYTQDKELQKEIWALGLRNPWRCSFDSARPSYFVCADVGQDRYEEVDLITKDGNYGWRAYEGPYKYNSSQSPFANTSLGSSTPIFPVMGYNHSDVNSNEGSASITGGYFYRATTDPCMHGSYLFADLYAGAIWAGIESPINSGKFTSSKISFSCALDSPLNCTVTPGSSLPSLSYIFSFGEDNNKDVYLLTNSGVYRVVRASRCNYACAEEAAASPPSAASAPPSRAGLLRAPCDVLLLVVSFLCLVFMNS